MKKNFKRFAAVLMVVAMMFSMAACGSDEPAGDEGGAAEFIIGGIGPTTGAAATYGEAVKNGAELAVAEINAAGGINGAQVKFVWQDDEHDAEKSVNAYNALKEKGYNAIGQLAGFIFSDDPSYLTSHNNARAMLKAVDRDELLEHVLRYYFEG